VPAWVAVVGHGIRHGAGAATGHAHHGASVAAGQAHHVAATSGMAERLVAGTDAWLVMVVAMMVPVVLPRVRLVARCSVGRVRNAAIAQTAVGAMLPWLALGAAVVPLVAVLPGVTPITWVAAWAMAAAWQVTPPKWVALRRCHAVRISRGVGDGWRRLHAGAAHGAWCVVSCGPLMAVMAWSGHPVVFAVLLAVGLVAERVAHRPDRASRRLAAAVVALSLTSFLMS
jgi:predicted metal-binding membrane protein